MKEFEYTIKDANGIHAIPACMLAMEAKKFKSKISIQKDKKQVDLLDLIEIMSLNVKKGQLIRILIEGEDEETAAEFMEQLFWEKL